MQRLDTAPDGHGLTRRTATGRGSNGRAPGALRVVALGGGTGLPLVLRGLKRVLFSEAGPAGLAPDGDRLTAVVTVADDGGSSGRLRQAYRVLPPGDIRNCLLALSSAQSAMAPLFEFRFGGTGEVAGHSLGNLILSALSHMEGDFCEAVEQASRLLGVRGRILPATLAEVTLRAEFDDGSSVEGESRIPAARQRIRRVRLQPASARVLPEAAAAIEAADIVVLGPGSLYTSLIPILLIDGVVDALMHARGRIVLVMNLMTQPGETDDFTAVDHVLAIRRHVPRIPIHDVLLNSAPIPPGLLRRYSADKAQPVAPDLELLRALGFRAIERDLLGDDDCVRHDPDRLAGAVVQAVTNREAQ
jgi:uncharacterized cofD-like protein